MHFSAIIDAVGRHWNRAMNLKHLRNLIALADTSNFARAAASANLSQPAFSRSIQSIEQELGARLFDRSGRRVFPTAFGKVVLERARRMVAEHGEIERDILLMKTKEYGNVSFGAGPLPAATIVGGMLTGLLRQHPNLKVRVEFGDWHALLERLIAEQLDFIIADIRQVRHHQSLAIQPLVKFQLRCFCRPGHPILTKRKIRPEDLRAYPLASFTHPNIAHGELRDYFGLAHDQEQLFNLECDNILLAQAVTMQTDVILVAPQFSPKEIRSRLVELRIEQVIRETTHFGIMELKNRTRSPSAAALIEAARRLCNEVASEHST